MIEQRLPLSGSTNGRPILVAAAASPGTIIHTAAPGSAGPGTIDEVHLWAIQVTGAATTLTIEWGGVTANDVTLLAYPMALNALPVKVADGFHIRAGLIVRAYSAAANRIVLTGYVRRWARTIYASKVGGPS